MQLYRGIISAVLECMRNEIFITNLKISKYTILFKKLTINFLVTHNFQVLLLIILCCLIPKKRRENSNSNLLKLMKQYIRQK